MPCGKDLWNCGLSFLYPLCRVGMTVENIVRDWSINTFVMWHVSSGFSFQSDQPVANLFVTVPLEVYFFTAMVNNEEIRSSTVLLPKNLCALNLYNYKGTGGIVHHFCCL